MRCDRCGYLCFPQHLKRIQLAGGRARHICKNGMKCFMRMPKERLGGNW